MPESPAYQNPVNQILHLQELTNWQDEHWLNYATQLGLTIADVPELIRLSWDEEPLDCENSDWSIHALRALTQLDPEAGINLYIDFLKTFPDSDFFHEEIDGLSREVGAIAIAPFVEVLGDASQELWLRSTAANGLKAIAKNYPECYDVCIKATIAQLENYREQDNEMINSVLVGSLIQLKVVEAAPLLEEVFANCEIDEWLTGSWAAAQVAMGLKQESDFSPEELKPKPPEKILAIQKMLDSLDAKRDLANWKGGDFTPAMSDRPVAKGFGSSKKANQSSKNKKKKR